jgi:hypothetical protein
MPIREKWKCDSNVFTTDYRFGKFTNIQSFHSQYFNVSLGIERAVLTRYHSKITLLSHSGNRYARTLRRAAAPDPESLLFDDKSVFAILRVRPQSVKADQTDCAEDRCASQNIAAQTSELQEYQPLAGIVAEEANCSVWTEIDALDQIEAVLTRKEAAEIGIQPIQSEMGKLAGLSEEADVSTRSVAKPGMTETTTAEWTAEVSVREIVELDGDGKPDADDGLRIERPTRRWKAFTTN